MATVAITVAGREVLLGKKGTGAAETIDVVARANDLVVAVLC